MEPGHPDLLTYTIVPATLRLTRAWIGETVEAEFVRADSPLIKRMSDPGFERGDRLDQGTLPPGERATVLYLSQRPRKAWNHGASVDRMLAQIDRRRPKDLEERFKRWLKQDRTWPIADAPSLEAILVRSEWGEKLKPEIRQHVVTLRLPDA